LPIITVPAGAGNAGAGNAGAPSQRQQQHSQAAQTQLAFANTAHDREDFWYREDFSLA
jgi:hypothetical protein